MINIFLDDFREPSHAFDYTKNNEYLLKEWVVVRNYSEFVKAVEKELPGLISFDHDLAEGHYHKNMQEGVLNYDSEDFIPDEHKTGYHCAKWLVDYCIDNGYTLCDFRVHSMNPVGKENIMTLLSNFKKFQDEHPGLL